MNPGDLCRFVRDDDGTVIEVEHVEPCRLQYRTGTRTDVRTGKVVSRP